TEPSAENFVSNHQLITTHLRIFGITLWVDIDELYNPITIGSGSRREKMGHNIAGNHRVFSKRFRFPGKHIRTILNEPLILEQPCGPARSTLIRRIVSWFDRTRPVWNGVSRVGNITVELVLWFGRRLK